MYFQDLIFTLQQFWAKRGCVVFQPMDLPMGAGTFHPATYLRSLGPEPWRAAYAQPCRRPSDARYGENPNRLGHYFQFQVIVKPSPPNAQELYLDSLRAIGIDPHAHDIRFVEDDWESPALGAWGLGWEVWSDGMEVTQFTYFQQCGGIELNPVSLELTYGLERLAMYLQNVDRFSDVVWVKEPETGREVRYGDVFMQNEVEQSRYNFEHSDAKMLFALFDHFENESRRLCEEGEKSGTSLVLPAYDYCILSSHAFNLLDARGAISVTERQRYILRVRTLARRCAEAFLTERRRLGYPLLGERGRAIADAELKAAAAEAAP